MKKTIPLLFVVLLPIPFHVTAVEIGGVNVPESVQVENNTLQLNGAGIRTKFFFDIYVAALYLEEKSKSAEAILDSKSTKRISMQFIYGEVEAEKMTDGWNRGFEKHHSEKEMAALRDRLNRFNSFFADAHKGDLITYDFLSDGSTVTQIKGETKGTIPGFDFQKALISVWLGSKPADKNLKQALLSH
ncbi:Chalcone isomerase-like [Mariprofundus ferrinatatus]|uniref:Chalcone isomerase-like n=1 Tax=Mariprofundus ferrinatatus TaxID=1921087 RepID=A0A2K8L5Y1_9PROT|nr:chalcone isomerase family protein [Mariprofundus ferrinatatus]ATX82735.1 Chalcone isomerase-like [Mariprofundus ferrinatatus]